ncbi:VOC family protein [Muriicola sp. Z0-33]|uniref:VOC family protein n=1 Tax=Muriicola sp. Z0-33 TaxID=2816957 RepID=UPI002238D2C5|nr:VOC family protein [Muriicola sp. Z0-33]MCW5516950.1 VOC family protein [Muriicola sp. Z0-33]
MIKNKGKFRFTYFTSKYEETFDFYKTKLDFGLGHFWDRNENDKGALFEAGEGLVEILHRPSDKKYENQGLDYRTPQGVYMAIQVWHIDEIYEKYRLKSISFKQEIVNQPWGHRSFSIIEPNGIILFFYQEKF